MHRVGVRYFVAILTLVTAASACASGTSVDSAAETATPAASEAPPARTVQPGAPGEGTRVLGAAEIAALSGAAYTEADVHFMQGMIHHHAQALEMVALMDGRTTDRVMGQLGLRIEISQKDEINLMRAWLESRGEEAPHVGAQGAMHGMMMMPGMLTPEQMEQLRASTGVAFERYFLEFMIQHHQGALVMVDELFAAPGAAQESDIFRFASDVDADQTMEISRMGAMLEARR